MHPSHSTMPRNPPQHVDWYDYPQYLDLAFRDETRDEAAFIRAACEKYARVRVSRLLEPGCGSGRLVVALAAQGFQLVAFDRSAAMVAYTRRRLARRELKADVFEADMTQFDVRRHVDAAFNTFDTFRHLLTESAARSFMQSVARAVRPGGIFVLGLHLLPPDASLESCERWTAHHRQTRLTATLRVLDASRRQRRETLGLSLRVRTPGQDLRLRSVFPLRLYTAAQLRKLLSSVPQWQLCDVFDFWYDIDHPLKLDNTLSDTVCVLRRI